MTANWQGKAYKNYRWIVKDPELLGGIPEGAYPEIFRVAAELAGDPNVAA